MQIREKRQVTEGTTPAITASCEAMEVHTVGGDTLPVFDTPLKPVSLVDRTITHWQAVPIMVVEKNGIYRADSTLFSKGDTILPFDQLAAIERVLQQTDGDDPNSQSNRVVSGPSPIAGFGAFAKRPYQPGEIIGFYTGNLVLRKLMPERLLSRYRRLTKKKWQDVVLPLYSIWRQDPDGTARYQTGPDTHVAWSQVKIYNKNIELGIDGEHSGNALRLLNHSNTPNTVPFPTVNPAMLAHIRSTDGQTYVKANSNLGDCLLIPVLAKRAIEKDEELTFHYKGYVSYTCDCYNFANTHKNIISNPEAMMTQKPGEFPDFIRSKRRRPPSCFDRPPRKGKQPARHRTQPDSSDRQLTSPVFDSGIVLHDLWIPLTPVRLHGESDQEFADRLEQLVNRPEHMSEPDSSLLDPDHGDSDWDKEDWPSSTDSDSDFDPEEFGEQAMLTSEEELSPYEDLDLQDRLSPGPEVRSKGSLLAARSDDTRPHSSRQRFGSLARKRQSPRWDKGMPRDQTNRLHINRLLGQLSTAAPDQYPELIWRLFSLYQTTDRERIYDGYLRLCDALNARFIPHDIEGEEPEWTPALAYHYFTNHGYIDTRSDRERYRLIPMTVFKEQVTRCQNGDASREVEQFCLGWLKRHYFHCGKLVFLLNLYGLNQRDGREWDLLALYRLLKAEHLSDQELMTWQTTVPNNHTLGKGLWHLIRSGYEHALHALIRHYFLETSHNARSITAQLNRGFAHHKGIFTLDSPWSKTSLFQYVVKHYILDLNNREVFHRIQPCIRGELAELLTAAEKQTLIWKPEAIHGAHSTPYQFEDKLLRDFITDSPAEREKNLANNLLHIYQVAIANKLRQSDIYRRLVSLLNHHGLHAAGYCQWSTLAIYDFWLSQGVLDQSTKYSVMSFTILKEKMATAEDPKKELAHYFHSWTKKQTASSFATHLTLNKITNNGERYTIEQLGAMMDEYNLVHGQQDPGQYKVQPHLKYDKSLADLPRQIRQAKDKVALKIFIEQWLIKQQHRNISLLSRLASHLKITLMRKGDSEETLEQFRAAFQADVWTTEGLLNFIIREGIIDFSNPENFSLLAPKEAGMYLPEAHCPDYACYAITLGKPAKFISSWELRRSKGSPDFTPGAFYRELGQHLAAKNITWPYTHEQIRRQYQQASPVDLKQLQALLQLETLQYQAKSGYRQAPDSLLVLLDLLRPYIVGKGDSKLPLAMLKGFQIKIPMDGECPVTSASKPGSSQKKANQAQSAQNTELLGLTGTVNWVLANLKRLLALHDQKFTDAPGPSKQRQ